MKTPEPGKYQGNLSETEMHHVNISQAGSALCSGCQYPRCFHSQVLWSSATGKALTFGAEAVCLEKRYQEWQV